MDKLVSIAGPALGSAIETSPDLGQGRLGAELAALLTVVNGFYTFESALHVFPTGPAEHTMDLARWNDARLWRSGYGNMTEGYLFFAEDVFGCQFAVKNETVFSFDPETGESLAIAETIEDWAAALLGDYEINTGYPLAHDWQLHNGALPDGNRLVPKRPFVLGGEFSVENLYAFDSVQGMRLRAELAVQLRDLPEGAAVTSKLWSDCQLLISPVGFHKSAAVVTCGDRGTRWIGHDHAPCRACCVRRRPVQAA